MKCKDGVKTAAQIRADEGLVDLDLRAKEFGNLTIAALLAFADSTGHELHIEFAKPSVSTTAAMPGPRKGMIR